MEKPLISFVIPSYNRRGRILKTLALLTRAAQDVPHETIVLDNASTDGTAEAVAEQFSEVKLIELSENLNAAARNTGLAAAQGEYVFMLDDDSWPAKGTLKQIAKAMTDNPRLGAAACYIRRPWTGAPYEAGGLPGVFVGCGVVLRKQAAAEVGGYPIDYGYYVEEYDLCARLWQGGWQVRWLGELLVWHDPEQAGRDKNRILDRLVANNLRFWSRYGPSGRRQQMITETIERYGRIAEIENALEGYRKGLKTGLVVMADSARHAKYMSEEQFAGLFGLEYLRRKLLQARGAGISNLLMWRRGKAAEQILEVAAEVGMSFAGMVEDNPVYVGDNALGRMATFGPEQASEVSADAVIIGSLSPGASIDLATEAKQHWRSLPIIDPVERPAAAAVPTAA